MEIIISDKYKNDKEQINRLLQNFGSEGTLLGSGVRNRIKIFSFGEIQLNVKSFKVPNPVNKIGYRFFRKSKAERSFNYARELLKRGVVLRLRLLMPKNLLRLLFIRTTM